MHADRSANNTVKLWTLGIHR